MAMSTFILLDAGDPDHLGLLDTTLWEAGAFVVVVGAGVGAAVGAGVGVGAGWSL